MSYEIFYDKRFLIVGEDMYIPIFQHGSNNCWEASYFSNRDVPEKRWSEINHPFNDRYIFSKEEIIKMGKACAKFSWAKARNKFMAEKEVEKLYINGYKGAKTLEYYVELGNTFRVIERDDRVEPTYYYPKTTEDLLEIITSYKGNYLAMGFVERKLNLPRKEKVVREKKRIEQYHFYVLSFATETRYFVALRKYGYAYVRYKSGGKKFITETEANRYLCKYDKRLDGFKVELVEESYVYYE